MLVPPVDRRVPLPLRVAVLLAALALAAPSHAQLILARPARPNYPEAAR